VGGRRDFHQRIGLSEALPRRQILTLDQIKLIGAKKVALTAIGLYDP
jgi:hypothetical protein